MEPTQMMRRNVYLYMMAELSDHTDRVTGEINSTTLAEDAANHFDLYEPDPCNQPCDEIIDYLPQEWIFDLACDIEIDRQNGELP